jgi:hypothetical protein
MKTKEKLCVSQVKAYCTNFTSSTKYRSVKKDENHFLSLFFTRRASRRLPSAVLFKAKHPPQADSFALKCLAYESLQPVQYSGYSIESKFLNYMVQLVKPEKVKGE